MSLPKMIVMLLLVIAVQPVTHAQQAGDEAQIRAVLARETEGWDQFDAKKVASTFTADAVWQNPFGVRLHGAAEIEKFLTGLMSRPGYRAGKDTAPTTILDLRITSPTTAAVWSDERIEGLVNDVSGPPDGAASFVLPEGAGEEGRRVEDQRCADYGHRSPEVEMRGLDGDWLRAAIELGVQ